MAGLVRRAFLSHTAELRQFPVPRSFVAAAEAAVTRTGLAIADMAYFTDRETIAEHREGVRGCDVYVGLIGLRYGSPVGLPEVSYTELEFNTATAAGLPRLIFLLDDEAVLPIPPAKALDADPGLQARQNYSGPGWPIPGSWRPRSPARSSWSCSCIRRCRSCGICREVSMMCWPRATAVDHDPTLDVAWPVG